MPGFLVHLLFPFCSNHLSSLGLVLEDGRTFLFDASPDIRDQLLLLPKPEKGNVCSGIFITHLHIGHYLGLLQLGKEAAAANKLPVFVSVSVAEFLSANEPFKTLVNEHRIDLKIVCENQTVALSKEVSVKVISVKHRSEFSNTFGFIISGPSNKRLLYIPDADDWTFGVEQYLSKVDFALLDGTFFSPHELPNRNMSEVPHPLIEASMEQLAEFREKIYFTHLNHTNLVLRNPELVESKGFHVAKEGQTFLL